MLTFSRKRQVELKGDEVLPAPTLDASEAPATEISSTEVSCQRSFETTS